MRKAVWLFFAFLLFLPVLTCADTEIQPPESFLFRNGITWSSTPEEVTAAEKLTNPVYTLPVNDVDVTLLCPGVRVSNYTANLSYQFHNDRLFTVLYDFDIESEHDLQYLLSAMQSKYGHACEPISAVLQWISSGFSLSESEFQLIGNWALADQTYIALFAYGNTPHAIYMDGTFVLEKLGYNADGL